MPVKTRKITVTREKKPVAAPVPVYLYCDGALVGTLRNGQSLTFDAPAGR